MTDFDYATAVVAMVGDVKHPKPEAYLAMADSVKNMPLEYARPLLDLM